MMFNANVDAKPRFGATVNYNTSIVGSSLRIISKTERRKVASGLQLCPKEVNSAMMVI